MKYHVIMKHSHTNIFYSSIVYFCLLNFCYSWTLQSTRTYVGNIYDDFGNNCGLFNGCYSQFTLINGNTTKIFTICSGCGFPSFMTFIVSCTGNQDGFYHICQCCFDAFYTPYLIDASWCLDPAGPCQTPSNNSIPTTSSATSDQNQSLIIIIAASVGGLIVIVLMVAGIVWWINRLQEHQVASRIAAINLSQVHNSNSIIQQQ